jgi:hypothetical protein
VSSRKISSLDLSLIDVKNYYFILRSPDSKYRFTNAKISDSVLSGAIDTLTLNMGKKIIINVNSDSLIKIDEN